MKTVSFLLIALFALIGFVSCTKEADDVTPTVAPSTELAGDYSVKRYVVDGKTTTVPSSAYTRITISASALSDNKARVIMKLYWPNDPAPEEVAGDMNLTRVNKIIKMDYNGQETGTYGDGILEIYTTETINNKKVVTQWVGQRN